MAFTLGGVLCDEISAGYTEAADLGSGVTSTKGFLCDWDDRFKVGRALLGYTSSAGKGKATSPGAAITFFYPAAHPELYNCFVQSIRFEGVGAPRQAPYQGGFTKCIVWANFGTMRFNPLGLAQNSFGDGNHGFIYAEQKMSSSAEYVTVPEKYTKFKTSGKKTGGDQGIRLALIQLEITLHALPYMPDFIVQQKSGQINDAAYLGFAAGKLMFNGVTTQESANTDGSYTMEGTYSFTGRSQRWDYGFDGAAAGGNGAWDQIVWPDNVTPFISSTSFDTIIPTGYSF